MAEKDVSRQTIIVLVFLAVLVSLLGTLTVMQEIGHIDGGDLSTYNTDSRSQAKVSLTVTGSEPITDTASGKVRLVVGEPIVG